MQTKSEKNPYTDYRKSIGVNYCMESCMSILMLQNAPTAYFKLSTAFHAFLFCKWMSVTAVFSFGCWHRLHRLPSNCSSSVSVPLLLISRWWTRPVSRAHHQLSESGQLWHTCLPAAANDRALPAGEGALARALRAGLLRPVWKQEQRYQLNKVHF